MNDRETRQLDIGTRVIVYWPDDDMWYKGTVAAENNSSERVLIEYDDGDSGWMDVVTTKWRSSSKPDSFLKHDAVMLEQKRTKVKRLKVGSRLSVWWPQEKLFYTGTLTKTQNFDDDDDTTNKPHYICYDDGDEEWINLIHRHFKLVSQKAARLKVGSRISVRSDEEDRFFLATITKIKLHKARPHRIKYDNDAKGGQWINLNIHPFLDADEPNIASDPSALPNANTLAKRKPEFLSPQPPESTRVSKKPKVEDEAITQNRPVFNDTCGICMSTTKRPRATSCYHIFCKRCIKNHCQNEKLETCPICKIPIATSRVKFDPNHAAFKAVEALERTTAEVAQTFSSASAASFECKGTAPFRVIEACQSKQRDGREHNGFYWRFKGSKDRILRVGEGINQGIAIEQVCLKTGEVIQCFPSGRKANEKTGVSRVVIKRVLERRGKANGGGFFWRFKGESHLPWPDPEPTNLNPVEQLDFETGDFLRDYISLAEAKRVMGMRMNSACIREVCDGKGRATAKGYFWRWKGSQALPNHMMGVEKILQIQKKKSGKVVKEFRTSREAQGHFGHQCCWSTICRHAREKGFHMGYYWKYRFLKEKKSPEEQKIGKRLRVKQPGNNGEWIEGKIDSFQPTTNEYKIIFDCGAIAHHKLEAIRYEWKNDQGQKPVEKLDLKSGEVLSTFQSISDAANSLGPSGSCTRITAVCTGRYQSSNGFFWRYKGSDAQPAKRRISRKVLQLCLKSGHVIATFDSITEAGKAVGITTPGISYCCNGRNGSKSAGGFGWRFATTDE